MDNTFDTVYRNPESTIDDVIAIVKFKIANNVPMLTAKEEFVEDLLKDAVDTFGYEFVFGKNKNKYFEGE